MERQNIARTKQEKDGVERNVNLPPKKREADEPHRTPKVMRRPTTFRLQESGKFTNEY